MAGKGFAIIQIRNYYDGRANACLVRTFDRMLRKTFVMKRTTTTRFTFWLPVPRVGLATRALLSKPINCS